MTMGIAPWREKVLDGEKVFTMWQTMGTLNLVLNQLIKEGISSPRTGKPITKAAVSMSAWRWAIRNPQQSFDKMREAQKSQGNPVQTREQWDDALIVHARQALTPAGYTKFLEKNHLETRARSI